MTTIDDLARPGILRKIPELIDALGGGRGTERRKARLSLVEIGKPSVPPLIEALKHRKNHVRWEAAKALVDIADESAAPALVDALMDEDIQVQWLAAEALIALGRAALTPLLHALTEDFDSVSLRHGAHHVLHDLKRDRLLHAPERQALESLESIEPEMTVPWAAQAALHALHNRG